MWKRGNSDGRYCVTCHFFLEIKDSKFKGVSLLRVWIHESIYHSVSCCLLCIAEAILSFQRDWLTGIPRASSHLGMSFSPFLFWAAIQGTASCWSAMKWASKAERSKSGLSGLKGKLSGRKDGSKKLLPKKSLRLWFGLWNLRDGQFLRIHLQMLTEPQRQQLRRFFRCLEKKVCKYGRTGLSWPGS